MRIFLFFRLISTLAFISYGHATVAQDKATGTLGTQMLKEHNEWREKYKVPVLIWDDALAKDAQNFANEVVTKAKFPPTHRRYSPNGENFFWGTAGAFEPKDAVARWESENKNYNRKTNTCAAGKTCVHFTQLVWSTTTKVGCGKATTADRETDFFVCVYSPAGNLDGVGPFTVVPATPASSRPPKQPGPTTVPTPSNKPAARRVG